MFGNLRQNLSKNQKIGIILVAQMVFIGLIVGVVNWAMQPRENVSVTNENTTPIPDANWRGVKNELWSLIEANVAGLKESDIDDATIRKGTYEETYENEITTAKFLLDIDSLKQTYAITVSWSNTVEIYDAIQINCPPLDQMKYPETVCYGMYNNTYSLDLYLPHAVYPEEDTSVEPTAPNYIIQGDEEAKTIDVMVSACNVEKFKKEAMEYLKSTPIDLADYTINYEVNSINTNC